jgi:hypothetical protein
VIKELGPERSGNAFLRRDFRWKSGGQVGANQSTGVELSSQLKTCEKRDAWYIKISKRGLKDEVSICCLISSLP